MLETSEIATRLVVAALLGALVGIERERKQWTAGLRTHMMVCVGACLIMIVSAFGFSYILGTANVNLDPSRIAAQVVSGIGFIGAGTILFSKQGTVHGLTTASGLWTVAAIGLATGSGMYFAAIATTIIALIILYALRPFEHFYSRKFKRRMLRLTTAPNASNSGIFMYLLNRPDITIENYTLDKTEHECVYDLTISGINGKIANDILQALKDDSTIKEIHWT